ncbi:hypothetical protein ZWY2020_050532 [Hordeum vulgare]|nr:hypothetical protein ZWY2020_050532 [Hordeum vulgare]
MADGRLNPADKLTEDLLVEILSRVPYKSLCRFKCVSKRWRGIISHHDHRKALPQYHLHDLAGFLYSSDVDKAGWFGRPVSAHNFTGVSVGTRPPVRPSLPFLPDCEQFHLLDSCNGLLLCRRFQAFGSEAFDYVVQSCHGEMGRPARLLHQDADSSLGVRPGCFLALPCVPFRGGWIRQRGRDLLVQNWGLESQ